MSKVPGELAGMHRSGRTQVSSCVLVFHHCASRWIEGAAIQTLSIARLGLLAFMR
jgi:hypothetical protein